jgi:hypothetical protein
MTVTLCEPFPLTRHMSHFLCQKAHAAETVGDEFKAPKVYSFVMGEANTVVDDGEFW